MMIDGDEVIEDGVWFDDYVEDCCELTDRQDCAGLIRRCRQRFRRYQRFITRGHLLFSQDELLRELLADRRFVVADRDECPMVSVRVGRR
jgi:hypothetical protein